MSIFEARVTERSRISTAKMTNRFKFTLSKFFGSTSAHSFQSQLFGDGQPKLLAHDRTDQRQCLAHERALRPARRSHDREREGQRGIHDAFDRYMIGPGR